MNILNALLDQMKNLQNQAAEAINNNDWTWLDIIQVKIDNLYNDYQKVCNTKNIVEVSSLFITQKTIDTVNELLGQSLNSKQVKKAITDNDITLVKSFSNGYMIK